MSGYNNISPVIYTATEDWIAQQTARGIGPRRTRLFVDYKGDLWGQFENNTAKKIAGLGGSGSTGSDSVPVGAVFQWISGVAPIGYLLCDGSVTSVSKYPQLSALLAGGTFGGSFQLPDFRGRVIVGQGNPSYTNNFPGSLALGSVGGALSTELSIEHLPEHSHDISEESSGEHTHSISVPTHSHQVTTLALEGHSHTVDGWAGTPLEEADADAEGLDLTPTIESDTAISWTNVAGATAAHPGWNDDSALDADGDEDSETADGLGLETTSAGAHHHLKVFTDTSEDAADVPPSGYIDDSNSDGALGDDLEGGDLGLDITTSTGTWTVLPTLNFGDAADDASGGDDGDDDGDAGSPSGAIGPAEYTATKVITAHAGWNDAADGDGGDAAGDEEGLLTTSDGAHHHLKVFVDADDDGDDPSNPGDDSDASDHAPSGWIDDSVSDGAFGDDLGANDLGVDVQGVTDSTDWTTDGTANEGTVPSFTLANGLAGTADASYDPAITAHEGWPNDESDADSDEDAADADNDESTTTHDTTGVRTTTAGEHHHLKTWVDSESATDLGSDGEWDGAASDADDTAEDNASGYIDDATASGTAGDDLTAADLGVDVLTTGALWGPDYDENESAPTFSIDASAPLTSGAATYPTPLSVVGHAGWNAASTNDADEDSNSDGLGLLSTSDGAHHHLKVFTDTSEDAADVTPSGWIDDSTQSDADGSADDGDDDLDDDAVSGGDDLLAGDLGVDIVAVTGDDAAPSTITWNDSTEAAPVFSIDSDDPLTSSGETYAATPSITNHAGWDGDAGSNAVLDTSSDGGATHDIVFDGDEDATDADNDEDPRDEGYGKITTSSDGGHDHLVASSVDDDNDEGETTGGDVTTADGGYDILTSVPIASDGDTFEPTNTGNNTNFPQGGVPEGYDTVDDDSDYDDDANFGGDDGTGDSDAVDGQSADASTDDDGTGDNNFVVTNNADWNEGSSPYSQEFDQWEYNNYYTWNLWVETQWNYGDTYIHFLGNATGTSAVDQAVGESYAEPSWDFVDSSDTEDGDTGSDGDVDLGVGWDEFATHTHKHRLMTSELEHTHALAEHQHPIDLSQFEHKHEFDVPMSHHEGHTHDFGFEFDFTNPDHSHDVEIPPHGHSLANLGHTHTVSGAIAQTGSFDHEHSFEFDIPHEKHEGHTHRVEVPAHTHTLANTAHTHSISGSVEVGGNIDHKHEFDIPHEAHAGHHHYVEIPEHTHALSGMAHSHAVTADVTSDGMAHTHDFEIDIPHVKHEGHTHRVEIPSHSHGFDDTQLAHTHSLTGLDGALDTSGWEHTHEFDIPHVADDGHTHRVEIPEHSHAVSLLTLDHAHTYNALDHLHAVDLAASTADATNDVSWVAPMGTTGTTTDSGYINDTTDEAFTDGDAGAFDGNTGTSEGGVHSHGGRTGAVGLSTPDPVETMPPYIAMNFIIKHD